MSDTGRVHEPSTEARWLQANWTRDTLGQYEDRWIAVKGEGVIDSDTSIAELMERTSYRDPLYAFAFLGPFQ
jgi:hypothetical protein